jgi:hypothetical protein
MARFQGLMRLFCFVQVISWALYAHAYTILSDHSLRSIPEPGDDFNIKTGALLAPILIPRVSGSDGSTKVLNHFVDFFRKSLPKWEITFQNSTSKTPATGNQDIPFINMIATRDPPWARVGGVSRLTLAAHYDSKLTPTGFIGAIDSAAPCAMLMHVARAVDAGLTKKWEAMQAMGVEVDGFGDEDEYRGVQILFLDGEESFLQWTATDSIYGARSLAAHWEATLHPALSTYRTPLDAISLFVLLDLLGHKDPAVPSYFPTTHWAYRHLAKLEERLRSLSLFKSSPNHKSKRASSEPRAEPTFLPDKNHAGVWFGGFIGDDHQPFQERGVEVLHIIPNPFPMDVWHRMEDDGEHLDLDTVADWTKLMVAFVAEWMELDGCIGDDRKRTLRSEL